MNIAHLFWCVVEVFFYLVAMPTAGFDGVDPNVDVFPHVDLGGLDVFKARFFEQGQKVFVQEHMVQKGLFFAEDSVHPRGVNGAEGHDLAEDKLSTGLEHPKDLTEHALGVRKEVQHFTVGHDVECVGLEGHIEDVAQDHLIETGASQGHHLRGDVEAGHMGDLMAKGVTDHARAAADIEQLGIGGHIGHLGVLGQELFIGQPHSRVVPVQGANAELFAVGVQIDGTGGGDMLRVCASQVGREAVSAISWPGEEVEGLPPP